ncbi:MAG: ferrochelatase [Inquilinus sp.]|nr:ferrochelatase [Inquilinus sp.]
MGGAQAAVERRIAVVLFNLGGPDGPDSVRPFLFNLFNDESIIRVPRPFRYLLARLISRRRAVEAGKIYAELGGGSPILPNTEAQAAALTAALGDLGQVRVFIAMRYWHPMSDAAARAVKAFGPDEVVLLPLYPQFSTTTTGSSLRVWHEAAKSAGLAAPTRTVCCYPGEDGFVDAYAEGIRAALAAASAHGRPRLLLSSHGLPETVVKDGDPYQWQCEQTALAIVERLGIDGLDWLNTYQSRVGPMKWIGPATEDEIRRAGADRVPLVVAPIAFVSEHSETLVELDIEYRELAAEAGVPFYGRVPTVSVAPRFIAGLAAMVRLALAKRRAFCSHEVGRVCPADWRRCPQAVSAGE